MTPTEINNLVALAKVGDIESRVCLCEHYLTDYKQIRCRHIIDAIYAQFIKIYWTLVSINCQSLVKSDSYIKSLAIDFQEAPNIIKLQNLITRTINAAKSISEDEYKRCAVIIQQVFSVIANQIDYISKARFGQYSTENIVSKITGAFSAKPSFATFTGMIKAFVDFAKTSADVDAAYDLFRELLAGYDASDIVTLKSNDIMSRIDKLARRLNLTTEFDFVKNLSEAKHGSTSAMIAVGVMYESGKGTDINEDQAEYWYLETIKAGNKTGATLLEKLRIRQKIRNDEKRKDRLAKEQARIALQESNMRIRIEQEKADEIVRHNKAEEEIQQKHAQDEAKRTEAIIDANTPYEAKQVRARFKYWNTMLKESDYEDVTISQGTYNALIAGGESAILSYIKSNITLSDNISHARMKLLNW